MAKEKKEEEFKQKPSKTENKKEKKKSKEKDQNKDKPKKKSILNSSISFSKKISVLDVVLSIRHLSIMLKSSMPLSEALVVLEEQTNNEKLSVIYGEINADVQAGMSMSESMRKYPNAFTHVMVSVINVGEQGGTLEKNLIFLADFLKENYELSRKVKGALVYPMVVFGLTAVEMLGVVFFIFPQLESLFESFEDPPVMTRIVLELTQFLQDYWPALLVGGIVVFVLMKQFLKTKIGKRFKDNVALKFPVFKELNRKHILTNFSRTLGILLESSIPITESIKISAGTLENHIYREAVEDVYKRVTEGQNLAQALKAHPNEFPPTYVKMIQVGEDTGTLEDNLEYLHDFYAEEVVEMSNNLATLLEPVLLVFIGLMIGLLAIMIIGPIFQMTGSIDGGNL